MAVAYFTCPDGLVHQRILDLDAATWMYCEYRPDKSLGVVHLRDPITSGQYSVWTRCESARVGVQVAHLGEAQQFSDDELTPTDDVPVTCLTCLAARAA